MIDPALIETIDPGLREPIKVAIMTLASTEILLQQIEANKLPLLAGFNGDAIALANQIIDAQQINRVLLGLHELGTQYLKERENA